MKPTILNIFKSELDDFKCIFRSETAMLYDKIFDDGIIRKENNFHLAWKIYYLGFIRRIRTLFRLKCEKTRYLTSCFFFGLYR